jgi:DeoR/GlpR family transcriptional regulator of sugar metabolism
VPPSKQPVLRPGDRHPPDVAPSASRPAPFKFAENIAASVVGGFASALTAAAFVVLHKLNGVVIASACVAAVAVGTGSYMFFVGRRSLREARRIEENQQRESSARLDSGPYSVGMHRPGHSELANAIFTTLWNRLDPSKPMNPMRMADMIMERCPELTKGRGQEEIIRDAEEIRVLRTIPTLERTRDGFFLSSDDFHLNRELALESKRQIAFAAFSYIQSGMSIALDGGTTTLEVVRALIPHFVARTIDHVRLTTSSIQICSELLGVPECREAIRIGELEVWSMAGPLHPSCWTMDPLVTEEVPWPLDIAIIGANGITIDGFYLPNKDGLEIKKTLIRAAPRTLIVADSSKVGRRLPELFSRWTENVTLITDRPADLAARRVLHWFPKNSIIYCSDIMRKGTPKR